MSTTPALSLPSAGSAFEHAVIDRRELRPDDVRIAIEYAGICHTDLHFGHNDHGSARYPMVPGHEIAGTIAEVGKASCRRRWGRLAAQARSCPPPDDRDG